MGFWIGLWNHRFLLFNLLLLWRRSWPGCRVVSILQLCFICLKLYSSLSRRVVQGSPMQLYKSSSVPTHQWQGRVTLVMPLYSPQVQVLWVELIEDSLTFKARGRVGDLRFYLQFISTGWTPLLHHCGSKSKKSMTMKKWFCLFSLLDLSTQQDQIPKNYWIHIYFLLTKVQATAYKENHVSREHEMQKVRHR